MEQDIFSSAQVRRQLLSGSQNQAQIRFQAGRSASDGALSSNSDGAVCPDSEGAVSPALLKRLQVYRQFYCLDQLSAACHSIHCTFSDPYEVMFQIWTPVREADQIAGTVYLLHGYYDHVGLYRFLIEELLLQGYIVICPDLPGHGLSSGPRASIIAFSDYTRALWAVMQATETQRSGPVMLIGQSTGGAVLIDWWLNHRYHQQIEIDATVMLAPLVRPWNWQQGLWSYHLLSPFVTRIRRTFSRNSHNENFLHFLKEDPLQPRYLATDWVGALKNWIEQTESADPIQVPLLIIQGEQDKTVDWRFNTDFLQQKFVGAEVRYYPRARHHLVNESYIIRQQWMTRLRYYLTHL